MPPLNVSFFPLIGVIGLTELPPLNVPIFLSSCYRLDRVASIECVHFR